LGGLDYQQLNVLICRLTRWANRLPGSARRCRAG